MSKIIGVAGKKRNGKTFFYETISKIRNDVVNVNFADALKHEVAEFLVDTQTYTAHDKLIEIFGVQDGSMIWANTYQSRHVGVSGNVKIVEQQFYSPISTRADAYERILFTLNGETQEKEKLRILMQYWGTEYRRKQDTNYWTNKFKEKINELKESNQYKYIVVCDLRFPNELELIKEMGGVTAKVYRPSIGYTGDHPSEVALDHLKDSDWNFILINDDSEYYSKQIQCVFNNLDTENVINNRDLGDEIGEFIPNMQGSYL